MTREHQGGGRTRAALKSIRDARPGGYRLSAITDNLSANKTPAIRRRARRENAGLCFPPDERVAGPSDPGAVRALAHPLSRGGLGLPRQTTYPRWPAFALQDNIPSD